MRNIYIYCCLLPALSIVEMNPLNIVGHVGGNVSFKCSNWDVWTSEKNNVKYLCNDPCKKDKDIIIKAAPGKTKRKDRIHLLNKGEGLFVTFIKLQKSDSKKYICGLERTGYDSYIEVNLKVTDGPKTTPKSVVLGSTLPPAFLHSSTMSPFDSETITDVFTSYPNLSTSPELSATQGAGGVPYFVVGLIVMVTLLLMAVLMLYRRITRKPSVVVSSAGSPHEDAGEANTEYEEIRGEGQRTERPPVAVSTVYASVTYAEVDPTIDLYANVSFHQDTEFYSVVQLHQDSKEDSANSTSNAKVPVKPMGQCAESRATDPQSDLVYSVAQFPKGQTDLAGHSEPNRLQSNQNDSYC